MTKKGHRLADRLGKSTHVSSLRMKLQGLREKFISSSANSLEDWLIDVANARGARIVFRENRPESDQIVVPEEVLSNEELVVGMCQLQCEDRPQMLRLAAQMISRKTVDVQRLCLIARRERSGAVLAALARQALRVEAQHEAWLVIAEIFAAEGQLRDALLHWTRLAEPIMTDGRCNAASWRLVA